MRNRNRLLTTAAAAAMLVTTLGGISAAPAHAAWPVCKGTTESRSTSPWRIVVPSQSDWAGNINCTMRRGDKGDGVRHLQRALRTYGYNIAVDGDFGPATKSALISFQKKARITADGIYASQTRGAICWPIWAPDADDANVGCAKYV